MTELAATIPNAKQYEEGNTATGRRWLERHEAVDRQIAPFGRRAMDRAHVKPGERVLDVGCGCGETTLELADRVGASGSVTGVDISRPLIEAARKRARELSRVNVRFEEGDAQTFPFPAKASISFSPASGSCSSTILKRHSRISGRHSGPAAG
jgi:SAM-dependent methyltransferase